MITSIDNSNLGLSNAHLNVAKQDQETAQKTDDTKKEVKASGNLTVKGTDSITTISENGDTVTISNNSQSVTKKTPVNLSVTKSYEVTEDQGLNDATASAIASAASGAGIDSATQIKNENSMNAAVVGSAGGTASSSSSTSSTSNLSQYTETELEQMLRDGEITQAEYNEEISSREDAATSSDSESENAAENEQMAEVEE